LVIFPRRLPACNGIRFTLGFMSAMPADPPPSPLDPVRILADLPESDRDYFLTVYQEVVTAAVDPEGFSALLRVLRLWWGHSIMAARPGYQEAREAARQPYAGGGMMLDDLVREIRAERGQ
jgi:hypothetical protein